MGNAKRNLQSLLRLTYVIISISIMLFAYANCSPVHTVTSMLGSSLSDGSTGSTGTNGSTGSTGTDTLFKDVQNSLKVSCGSCHNFHSMTSAQLVSNGLVVPGNALNSQLYYRIKGSLGTKGPKNMPERGSITSTEIQTMETWINSL